jgi:hypothetical protein
MAVGLGVGVDIAMMIVAVGWGPKGVRAGTAKATT